MLVTVTAALLASCGQEPSSAQSPVVAAEALHTEAVHLSCIIPDVAQLPGDPRRGKSALGQFGCLSCHSIHGMVGGAPEVGPPLKQMRRQRYIAGVLQNTPENLVRWIMSPTKVDPLTAMPDLGVSAAIAQDMTAYLYSGSDNDSADCRRSE